MRFLCNAAYLAIAVMSAMHPLILAAPSGNSTFRSIGKSLNRGPRQWHNKSQIPADPQIFCRNESQPPIYTGKFSHTFQASSLPSVLRFPLLAAFVFCFFCACS